MRFPRSGKPGYGLQTAALSSTLFNNEATCGACYEIKCIDDQKWCKPGTITVTSTNQCPPNYYESSDNSGWCDPLRAHFDLSSLLSCILLSMRLALCLLHTHKLGCDSGFQAATRRYPIYH